MVSDPVENDYQKIQLSYQIIQKFYSVQRGNSSSKSELAIETSGMASIRQNLSSKGMSERAIKLTSNAQRLVLTQITNRPAECELAGVIESELIPSLKI